MLATPGKKSVLQGLSETPPAVRGWLRDELEKIVRSCLLDQVRRNELAGAGMALYELLDQIEAAGKHLAAIREKEQYHADRR